MSLHALAATPPELGANKYLWAFISVFALRYIRVIANIVGNIVYKPIAVPREPKHIASDVTVVIPTIGLNADLLYKVIRSILSHPIARLIIVTDGPYCNDECTAFTQAIPDARVKLLHCTYKGRRQKTALAMPHIHTPFVALQDNKTTWPATTSFIPLLLAPFDDPRMGAVMPLIEARHHHHRSIIEAFHNFLGMTYLMRRAHEYRACNAIDGGLSTLTARFGLFRTSIYTDKVFQYEYLNEYCWLPFFGRKGPLDADDDKFHTRWLIEHGWRMKIQACPDTTLVTENGESNRFASQVLRWTRTTWRSNPRELIHGKVWRRHPFTAVTLALWTVRVSLVHEPLMFWLLYNALQNAGQTESFPGYAAILVYWILVLKFNKLSPHFAKYPRDLVWFVPYLLLGWFCSLVKIWALFTLHKTEWVVAEPTRVVDYKEDTYEEDE